MSERHKATVVLARELPSRWVNMCSLQKKWDASKFRPITEFKNPIHPSYVDTEREGHVCRSPTVPARVETPDEEPPSTPTPQSRTNLRKNVPCFMQIPNCTLVLPSEVTFAYHSWIFFIFFWGNSTGSGAIYPVLSQKAKLISPSSILGFAPDEQLI